MVARFGNDFICTESKSNAVLKLTKPKIKDIQKLKVYLKKLDNGRNKDK